VDIPIPLNSNVSCLRLGEGMSSCPGDGKESCMVDT
jgi:hypothetical protein